MRSNRGYDEVMIVNPYEPGSATNQGVRLMRFYAAPPGMGYYSELPEGYGYYSQVPEGYGYYSEPPEAYGYYSEPPEGYGYYGEPPEPYGYYADPGYGYYASLPEQYGEVEPGYNEYEPMAYFAEEYPMGYYNEY